MIHRHYNVEPIKLTHKAAVRRMSAWLQNRTPRCSIVLTELTTRASETPDVLGFGGTHSTLIECKVSRSDFLGDKKKSFRRREEDGVGDHRYFASPSDIIKKEEVPDGWGLIHIGASCCRIIVEPEPKTANKRSELSMALSVIRRLEISTCVFVREELPDFSTEPEGSE